MIILGALIAVWGGIVLGFANRLHTSWKGMLAQMRRDGVTNTIPGTKFLASEDGLRWMRIAGAVALAVGLGMIALGIVHNAGGPG
jgi:hypothetical protein